jgi:tetratricopeptide (TPR) repeat protein
LKWIEFKIPQNKINLLQTPTPILDDDIVEKQCKLDDNTIEEDTFRSAIVNLLLCLSYVYIELRHYTCSIDCLNECLIYADDNFPDIYFRRSQSRMYNRLLDDDQLLLALADIQKAISIVIQNKIYDEHYRILTELIEQKKTIQTNKLISK